MFPASLQGSNYEGQENIHYTIPGLAHVPVYTRSRCHGIFVCITFVPSTSILQTYIVVHFF